MVQRNMLVYRHSWIVIFSGFFEPLFYLLGIGYGLGTFVGDITLANGQVVPYAVFVAPALLAQSTMNGAISETIFNVFFKLNFEKIYDAVLATPLGVGDIALGELMWAMIRATIYAVAFIAVMLVMGLLISPWAVLALPATLFCSLAFCAAGLATTTYLRTVQDFDLPFGLVIMPMFLFSGTFFPITIYPEWLQFLVQLTPLYHCVELLRGLTTGAVEPTILAHVGYLAVFGSVGMVIARRRLAAKLVK
ncbi:MAG: ABC transporter [Chloroflexi bacterium]|nr:MAG: ABC transporter [Chloroflexota bacterium]